MIRANVSANELRPPFAPRFRLLARLYQTGLVPRRVPTKGFRDASYIVFSFPSFLAQTMSPLPFRKDFDMKPKRVKCHQCGTKYRPQTLSCPTCEAPNPLADDRDLTKHDRLIAVSLIAFGIVIGIPVAVLLIGSVWMGGLRGIRAAAAGILLMVIPVGAVFHGILLLSGVRPKEFYSWWQNRGSLERRLAWCLLALLILIFVIVGFFGEAFAPTTTTFDDD